MDYNYFLHLTSSLIMPRCISIKAHRHRSNSLHLLTALPG